MNFFRVDFISPSVSLLCVDREDRMNGSEAEREFVYLLTFFSFVLFLFVLLFQFGLSEFSRAFFACHTGRIMVEILKRMKFAWSGAFRCSRPFTFALGFSMISCEFVHIHESV